MKGFMAVLFFVALFSLMCAQAARIKWAEMTNTYQKSDAELQQWANGVEAVTEPSLYEDLLETKRRIDILWTEYTNRMERIAKMQEKRKAAEEKRKAEQARREALRRMSRRGAK